MLLISPWFSLYYHNPALSKLHFLIPTHIIRICYYLQNHITDTFHTHSESNEALCILWGGWTNWEDEVNNLNFFGLGCRQWKGMIPLTFKLSKQPTHRMTLKQRVCISKILFLHFFPYVHFCNAFQIFGLQQLHYCSFSPNTRREVPKRILTSRDWVSFQVKPHFFSRCLLGQGKTLPNACGTINTTYGNALPPQHQAKYRLCPSTYDLPYHSFHRIQ